MSCERCYRKCLRMHGRRRDDSSKLSKFFKIMFGKTFDHVLVVPPAFSKKLQSLVGKQITLHDCNKHRWDVRLTTEGKSLTFGKGWCNFVMDHNIEMGDLLVFDYLKNADFMVEIFGRSGCPKNSNIWMTNTHGTSESHRSSTPTKHSSDSSYEQPPLKRPKNVHVVKEPSVMARNVPSQGNIRRSRVVPMAKTCMEPCSMTRRSKSRPNVVPEAETLVEPWFMPSASLEKNMPREVHVVKEPSVMARNVPSQGHIGRSRVVPMAKTRMEPCPVTRQNKSRPNVVEAETLVEPWLMPSASLAKNMPKEVPVTDTQVESSFMTSQEKSRPKVVPMPDTLVEPCFMTRRDRNIPNVVSDTFAEPCFMRSRDKSIPKEDDRDLLFDLSAFEIPEKKPIIDKGKDTDYLLDASVYGLPAKETDANRTGKLHPQGNICGQVSDTFQDTATGIPDNETTIDRDDVRDHLLDISVLEMPEIDNAKVSDKVQPHGNVHYQESDKNQNAETRAASINLQNGQISERKAKVLSESHQAKLLKHEFAPLPSRPSDVDLPIDSVMPLKSIGKQTSDFSALPGGKLRLNNQEKKVCKQEFGGHAGGSCSMGTSLYISEPNHGNLVESLIHRTNVKGENMRFIKQESRKVEQDIRGDEMVVCGNMIFNANLKVEVVEPVDCVAVTCSVPPHGDFLELPETFPVVKRVQKHRLTVKHQLVFLGDPAGRVWPVVYHNKNGLKVLTAGWKEFMKVNDIRSGDECIFTVENSVECKFTVQIVPHY